MKKTYLDFAADLVAIQAFGVVTFLLVGAFLFEGGTTSVFFGLPLFFGAFAGVSSFFSGVEKAKGPRVEFNELSVDAFEESL